MAGLQTRGKAPMTIKSYFSRDPENALATARAELGPEAVLVESRKAPPESRHLGEYEVVFAIDAPREEPARAPVSERLSLEVAELKKELEGMRRTLTRTAFAPSNWPGASANLSDAYAILTANDVTPELAGEVAQGAESRLAASSSPPVPLLPRAAQAMREAGRPSIEGALLEELESRFRAEPALGKGAGTPRVVALVGPPGGGKTTTLVKLAVNYGLASRRPVLLLSMDTYRVAAAEQLRSFAAILGVGIQVLETVNALAQSIEENRGKELILIDTPGMAADDLENSTGLSRFLAARPDVDTQLVLSASMKPADLTRVVDSFEVFRPQRLLFTRLDETATFGSIFNEAARTGKPLSFFANGQRIPEDLEAASRERLSRLILAPPSGGSRTGGVANLG
jgi:flagellar biosynthesis protein FlhF